MAHDVWIRGLSGAGFRPPAPSGGYVDVNENVSVEVDLDNRATALVLAGERDNFIRTVAVGTFTVTIATGAVFTKTAHGLSNGDIVQFTTTGALPTGLTAGTNYYVIDETANTFEVSTTHGGTAVNTSGSQSGTHTLTPVSANITGLTQYGFRIKNVAGTKTLVNLGVQTQVDLTSGEVRRLLRRNKNQWAVALTDSLTALSIRGIQKEQNGFNTYQQDAATATLTSSNSGVGTNGKIVTLGATTYTLKTALTEAKATDTVTTSGTPASVRATGTVTTSGTGAANNDTITVGGVTYTFKTTLTGAANEVLRDGTEDHDLTNLTSAINATAGSGTTYGTGTVINPQVSAGSITSHVLALTAKSYLATNGNAVTLAKTGSVLTVSGANFTGGTNETVNVNGQTYTFVEALDASTANEILINGQDTSLTNLAAAINGTSGSGTTYGTGTVANTFVSSGAVTSHSITLTALTVGTGGNAYTLAVTGSHLSRGAATFSGGLNSVANEVKIGGSADATLTDLSEAINAGANAGVDYSSATTANLSATASTVTAHAITLTAILTGDSGNHIVFTTNEPTYTIVGFSTGEGNQPVAVYKGITATVDITQSNNFTQLRRHYRDWVES